MKTILFSFLSFAMILSMISCASIEKANKRDPASRRGADGHTVSNGGDVIYCSKSNNNDLEGVYVLDEAMANRDGVLQNYNSDEYIKRLISKLKEFNYIGYELEYFYESFKTRNGYNPVITNLKWIPNDGALADINDEEIAMEGDEEAVSYIRTLPKNCDIRQAIVRRNTDDSTNFYMHKKSVNELIGKNKIDWLIIHEFLWTYFSDVTFIRDMNEFLHDKNIFNFENKILTLKFEKLITNFGTYKFYKSVNIDSNKNINIFENPANKRKYFTYNKSGKYSNENQIKQFWKIINENFLIRTIANEYLFINNNISKKIDLSDIDNVIDRIELKQTKIKFKDKDIMQIYFKDKSSVCHYINEESSKIINCPNEIVLEKTPEYKNKVRTKIAENFYKYTDYCELEDVVTTKIRYYGSMPSKPSVQNIQTEKKVTFTNVIDCKYYDVDYKTIMITGTSIKNGMKITHFKILYKTDDFTFNSSSDTESTMINSTIYEIRKEGIIEKYDIVNPAGSNYFKYFILTDGVRCGIFDITEKKFEFPLTLFSIESRQNYDYILTDKSGNKGFLSADFKCYIDPSYNVIVMREIKDGTKAISRKFNDKKFTEERYKELCLPIPEHF